MAKLYFRYGAMNSGKSTALMQVAHNYEEQGMRVLILKPQVDTKGGGELVSRLGVRRKADLLIPPETDVFEAVRTASNTSVSGGISRSALRRTPRRLTSSPPPLVSTCGLRISTRIPCSS